MCSMCTDFKSVSELVEHYHKKQAEGRALPKPQTKRVKDQTVKSFSVRVCDCKVTD